MPDIDLESAKLFQRYFELFREGDTNRRLGEVAQQEDLTYIQVPKPGNRRSLAEQLWRGSDGLVKAPDDEEFGREFIEDDGVRKQATFRMGNRTPKLEVVRMAGERKGTLETVDLTPVTIKYLNIMAAGGMGVAMTFEAKNNQGQTVKFIVKGALKDDNTDDFKEEKGMHELFEGAMHIVQQLHFIRPDKDKDKGKQVAEDNADWREISPGRFVLALNNILFVEYMPNGALSNAIGTSFEKEIPFPSQVLWRVFQCLAKGTIAMGQPGFWAIFEDQVRLLNTPFRVNTQEEEWNERDATEDCCVHFDLDPLNIFVGGPKENDPLEIPLVKIGDLGLSQLVNPSTADRDRATHWRWRYQGKANYFAPEQFTEDWDYIGLRDDIAQGGDAIAGHYCKETNVYWIGLTMLCMMSRRWPTEKPVLTRMRLDALQQDLPINWTAAERPPETVFTYGGAAAWFSTGNDPRLVQLIAWCTAARPLDRPHPRLVAEITEFYLSKGVQNGQDIGWVTDGEVTGICRELFNEPPPAVTENPNDFWRTLFAAEQEKKAEEDLARQERNAQQERNALERTPRERDADDEVDVEVTPDEAEVESLLEGITPENPVENEDDGDVLMQNPDEEVGQEEDENQEPGPGGPRAVPWGRGLGPGGPGEEPLQDDEEEDIFNATPRPAQERAAAGPGGNEDVFMGGGAEQGAEALPRIPGLNAIWPFGQPPKQAMKLPFNNEQGPMGNRPLARKTGLVPQAPRGRVPLPFSRRRKRSPDEDDDDDEEPARKRRRREPGFPVAEVRRPAAQQPFIQGGARQPAAPVIDFGFNFMKRGQAAGPVNDPGLNLMKRGQAPNRPEAGDGLLLGRPGGTQPALPQPALPPPGPAANRGALKRKRPVEDDEDEGDEEGARKRQRRVVTPVGQTARVGPAQPLPAVPPVGQPAQGVPQPVPAVAPVTPMGPPAGQPPQGVFVLPLRPLRRSARISALPPKNYKE